MSTRYEQVRAELEAVVPVSGVSPSLLLEVGEPLRSTLKALLRRGSLTLSELAGSLEINLEQTLVIADLMVRAGFVRHESLDTDGSPVVRIIHAQQATRPDSAAAHWSRIFGDS